MSSLVVSVVRRPDEIVVRFATRSPEVGVGREAVGRDIYSLTDRDLADAGEADLPHGKRLRRAFDALSQAESLDLEVFEQVLWILLGTVPSARPLDLPPTLPASTAKPSAKRTAAHPRGFRGTKYQPPKLPRPKAIDLRPALCERNATHQILERGWHFRHRVLPSIADELEVPRTVVDRWLKQESPPQCLFAGPWSDRASNPIITSPAAVENLLWLMRRQSPQSVEHLAALYDRWVQVSGEASTAAIVHLAALMPPDRAIQWLVETERQPPEQRKVFLSVILESEVALRAEPCRRLLQSLADLAQESRYLPWAWSLLEALHHGVDPAYLEAGVRLMAEHRPDHYFHSIRDCRDYDEAVIEGLLLQVPSDEISDIAVSLWQGLGWIPRLMQHLKQLPPNVLAPRPLANYLYFLHDLCLHAEDTPLKADRWSAFEKLLPDIQAMLSAVPPSHGAQASNDLALIVENWTETREVESCLPRALELFERIQKPPLNPDGHFSHALRILLELDLPEPNRLLKAPFACFVRLDKSCRRRNGGQLIGWGLSSLARYPELVMAGFETETATLARIAKTLGAYNWQERTRMLESWEPGRLLDSDLQDLPASELVGLLRASGADEKVVPKALREFLTNRRPLTDRQVEGHRRRIIGRLTQARLASLLQHIIDEMGRSVGTSRPDRELQLALQLLADAGPSRRGLRRFLNQYLAGNESYLMEHPANRAWLRRRPALDPILWTKGIKIEGRDGKGRAVILTLEQNPFEILKLGTYVGSCLGLGGDYSWSAVSVLLDINKQVIYARDSSGRVLARQLVAISSDQELVPFEVYPEVDEPMLDAFRAYDHTFAQALGLEISTDWESEIEAVVAPTWWNDYPWTEFISDSDKPDDCLQPGDPGGGEQSRHGQTESREIVSRQAIDGPLVADR